MAFLEYFQPPANQNDFPNDPNKHQELLDFWTTNVSGWINQAIVGNPWNVTNASNQTFFYNPLYTIIPNTAAAAQIPWNAFPNRLSQYLKAGANPANPYNKSDAQILQLADSGYWQKPETPANSFPKIPTDLCPQVDWSNYQTNGHIYGPYGPRGWQDEYCEWSVTRDSNNNIIRIDFVCENSEYWHVLWKIDPEKVRELYEETLNYGVPPQQQISVALEDLQLLDPETNQPVIDPETKNPAYNPLNKWNSGPISVRTGDSRQFSGGAMHLTSTPNTLQTELGLAGAATVQRQIGNSDPQKLICCSQYGQAYRNSDPTIGRSVNQAVQGQGNANIACLADPVGLYIQMPDFNPESTSYSVSSQVKLPEGATVGDCWQIVRGQKSLVDSVTNEPFPGEYYDPVDPNLQGVGNFILHAVFQIPQSWQNLNDNKLTLSDILIQNQPIIWAGQVARTFNMSLYARPIPTTNTPPALDCVGTPTTLANQPLQLIYADLWNAYYNTSEPNPAGQLMPLASNTTFIITRVEQNQSGIQVVLTYAPVNSASPPIPTVEFSTVDDQNPNNQSVDSQIAAKVLGQPTLVSYAVPGNSYPSDYYALSLELDITSEAAVGVRGVRITDPGQIPAAFAPSVLNVVAAGTLSVNS
ncbi:MAG: hypothetical protein RM021_010165 [Nostoc sp. EkiNYC01]|nr:hypothetical protein [Nostoc sp. EkiNYC01]